MTLVSGSHLSISPLLYIVTFTVGTAYWKDLGLRD